MSKEIAKLPHRAIIDVHFPCGKMSTRKHFTPILLYIAGLQDTASYIFLDAYVRVDEILIDYNLLVAHSRRS